MDRADFAKSQWDREIPGLDLSAMVLLGRLGEAAQLIAKDHLEPVFAAHGLKAGEFDVLATLRRSGPPYRLKPTELYNSTMISSGGMTARLDRLQKAGLVTRTPDEQDRRALQVSLTDKGKALIETVLPQHIAAQKGVLAGLDAKDRATLSGLLERLVQSLTETADRQAVKK